MQQIDLDLQQIFLESASEVLETMFFTGIESEGPSELRSAEFSAELVFRGIPSGRFGVQVPVETGEQIAANFLGAEEVTSAQVDEVLCELCNMLCGSVLSRLATGARFELLHPEIDRNNLSWYDRPHAIGYTFGLEEGAITLWMVLDQSRLAVPAA
ncbi:MAG TPA: chemotaxis protein CheX [Bryobacteraceae bacterium]|jgi:CheY-specific phosphatase CheX|nr:chemotaxis protein CheX [Bryobacteraceae bacterium]